jgi:hypothetical protein
LAARSLISFVASTPLIPAPRLTSINTTSISPSAARSTASSPVVNAPTNSMSSAIASMDSRPCETSVWSSAIIVRSFIA